MAEAKSGAILFNKRGITALELPFAHTFGPQNNGWRIEILEDGRLTAKYVHGGLDRVNVQIGDSIVASGEEIYLSLKLPPAAQGQPAEPSPPS